MFEDFIVIDEEFNLIRARSEDKMVLPHHAVTGEELRKLRDTIKKHRRQKWAVAKCWEIAGGDANVREIVKQYLEGVPLKTIMQQFNIDPFCLYILLEAYGWGAMRRKRRKGRFNIEECLDVIEKLYRDGVPVKEIAERCGYSMGTVYRALERLEAMGRIKRRKGRRKTRRLTEEELKIIKKLYELGASVYEIAKRLGRHPSTIHYALKRLGLK